MTRRGGRPGAVSLNITVTNTQGAGFILIFPQGETQPVVSTLNYVAGQTVANAAVVSLGTAGGVTVVAGVSGTDLIIDTNGDYGSPAADSTNLFLGPNAGNATMTGSGNTAIGDFALFANTTGSANTASGTGVLPSNTIGSGNTASGLGAMHNNTAGSQNTASGRLALNANTTGSANTAIGGAALGANTTGVNNIAIGFLAGTNLTTGSGNIDIGNGGVAGESATIRIGTGGTQTQAFLAGVSGVTAAGGVAVLINSAGQLGTIVSSRRFKQDIENMGEASQALMKLRPVTFRYKASLDPSGSREYGLIAEEVAEVFPDLVVYEKDGQPETVRYHVLVPMLLNEVQKDRKAITDDRETIAEDRKAIAEDRQTIADLTARLGRLEALMSESVR